MSHGRKFNLSELLSIVSADKIYIGLPDPTLYNYEINDPFLNIQTIIQTMYHAKICLKPPQKRVTAQKKDAFASFLAADRGIEPLIPP